MWHSVRVAAVTADDLREMTVAAPSRFPGNRSATIIIAIACASYARVNARLGFEC